VSRFRFGLRAIAYLLLVAVAVGLIVTRWPELSGIWREHLGTFAGVTLLMAVAIIVQARNFILFLPQCNGPALAVMTRIWAVGALVNYLGPFQPGLAMRVALLGRLGIPIADSSVATLRQVFASLWLALLVASISLIAIDAVAMAIPAGALIAMFLLTSQLLPMLRGFAARVLTRRGALELKQHIEMALVMPTPRAALGILAQYALGTAVFYVGYRQFGVDITVASAAALACVIYASSILALFPGNFGVLEALCAAFGQVNGLSVDQALALAFLYRGANVVGAVLLATIPSPPAQPVGE